jgi:hypothetical protein
VVLRRHGRVRLELVDGATHVLGGDAAIWSSPQAIRAIVNLDTSLAAILLIAR